MKQPASASVRFNLEETTSSRKYPGADSGGQLMAVTEKEMQAWCETLLAGRSAAPDQSLSDYIRAIPGIASLEDLPKGSPVLLRGDLDCKPGPQIGDGDIRLRSMVDTLRFGIAHDWKQIIFGHIGRKPEGSLSKVAQRLGEIVERGVPLISDWLDDSSMTILPSVAQQIATSKPGSLLMLENTRKY